jgi:hypothetical protein
MSAVGKNVRFLFSQFKILMKDLEHEARTAVLASFGGYHTCRASHLTRSIG